MERAIEADGRSRYSRMDVAGLALSAACLVHCLALPLALVGAPTLAAWLGHTESTVHWVLFAVAAVISGAALHAGFRRHRAGLVLASGGIGLAILAVAAAHLFGTSLEASLTLLGAGILAFAHVLNLKLSSARPPFHP